MKTALCIALCAISLSVYSQNQEETVYFRPLQGNKTFSFNIAGLATMALNSSQDPLNNAQVFDFRYFYKDDLAFRLGLGINNLSTTTTLKGDSSASHVLNVSETEVSSSGLSIGLGVEKHLKTKSRSLDPYAGVGLYFSILGDETTTANNKSTMANADYAETKTITVVPGGNAFGVVVNGGFFWYFTQNLALGAELSLGFVSASQGGEGTVSTTNTTSTGGSVHTTETKSTTENTIDISALQTLNTGAIHLLIKF